MKCPFCFHPDTQVMDSRIGEDGSAVRRRRRCVQCEKRFTTYERIELRMPQVIKRNGMREEFDAKKLSDSVWLALRKREVTTEQVDQALSRIQEKLMITGNREVDTGFIGALVMEELLAMDKIAWIRFASVYRNFDDTQSFLQAIAEVEHRNKNHDDNV